MKNADSNKSKRIIKNTLFLYLRHLFIMFVSFFTARIVLDRLGVVDYGIQNVVGGLASMFAFFRSSLSNATQRFLSIALGHDSIEETKKTFKQHQSIYVVITLVLLVLLETAGLYIFYNKLIIPLERMTAAFWVYQFTVISLCITLLSVVYDAVLIAHENMKIYSYVGIFEALSKLAIALGIAFSPVDRLITYAFLLLVAAVLIRIFYTVYCKRMYSECSFSFLWNKKDVKNTFTFISWNFVGTAVWAINNNGIDILLNMFFGPVVNAAKGVANQVNFAVTNFSNGFLTSVQPQLTKSYASRDFEYLYSLFFKSTKYSFLLLWFFCYPIFFVVDEALHLWLTNVPTYASSFVCLILLYSLVNSFNQPVWILAQAVGKLKWYICIGSFVFLMIFPISYVLLKLGYSPNSVFIANVAVRAVYIVVVFMILRRYICIPIRDFLAEAIKPVLKVLTVAMLPLMIFCYVVKDAPYAHFLCACLAFVWNIFVIYVLGLSRVERSFVALKILKVVKR